MMVVGGIAVFFYKVISSRAFEIFGHHFRNKLFETDFRDPSEFLLCFGCISEKGLDFCRAEIAVVDGNYAVSIGIKAFFLNTTPLPCDGYTDLFCCSINKLTNAMLFTRSNNKILRFLLLEHEPLHFNIIFGMSPIAQGIKVSEVEAILKPKFYAGKCTSNLAGNKGLASERTFMVEENPVAGIDTIRLTIIDRDPLSVELGNTIRTSWIKRSSFLLRNLLDKTKEF